MKRLVPHPLLASLLLAVWLLLNETLDPSHVLLGAMLALVASRAYARLGPHPLARKGRPGAIVRLFVMVTMDIVRSNIAVARIVLGWRNSTRRAGFLPIPLETRHSGALATLAIIVTATPGTCWAGYDAEQGVLTLHVLDLDDEEGFIRVFKTRYEQTLQVIYE
jgi:multicomponent K+:H+ antiporter subunit E